MKPYDHKKIESKWQKIWEKKKIYQAKDNDPKPKFYSLIEFPFPSGEGLHTGHIRSNTAMDIISRKRRMEGFNVLYPIGWDAFGLPTENYAIKTGIHPKIVTKKNTDTYRRQLKAGGYSFDWSREVDTSDPEYYKWTQWIFLEMYKRGLAYKKKMTINWCPKDTIGLANEEVIDGKCERCGTPVEKREKEQWMLAITKYADRLDKDLDTVDFLEKIKIQQRNWIGRSEGAELEFKIKLENTPASGTPSLNKEGVGGVRVFTTRADTLFGVTYVVLAPEHELVKNLKAQIKNWSEVEKYITSARKKDEADRTAENKEKTGVELKGVTAINPANGEEVSVWIADYVLAQYGTGAVMAVSAHDDRDFAFAKKYNLPIKDVVMPSFFDSTNPPVEGKENTKRPVILGIIYNPKTKKYLCLKWKKQPWTTFVIGGIENEEDAVVAARREILEETGYTDLKLVRLLGGPTEAFFYAAHKNVNRQTRAQALLFELINDTPESISHEEKEKHEVIWLTADEVVKAKLQHSEFSTVWERVITGKDCYVGDGVLIDSGEFTGMGSEEARTKIAEKFGKIKVTYKLRDWIFSRQRYWGEPIPMVYCEQCANRKPKVLIIHGLSATPESNWYQDAKKRLEKLGYEVIIPDLPKSEHVLTPKDWLKQLDTLDIDPKDDLYIVGHSLGGATAIQYVLKNKRKVKKLILVAPAGKQKEHKNLEDKFTSNQITTIVNFENAPIDFKKLNALVDSATLIYSEDDPIIPFTSKEAYKDLKAKLVVFKNKKHFSSRHNIVTFPELEEEFVPAEQNRGWVPVPEKYLPVKLPDVQNYQPTDTGESPLASMTKWVNVTCPVCKGPARRETDTMPNWAGSSWYYLRYIDPKNKKAFADPKKLAYWLGSPEQGGGGVDWYNGGMEHTTLHLLYSRFWHKFLFDIGVVPTCEPYKKRTSHGLILAQGGEKMSKSKGNVINPDGIIEAHGADTLRLYEMFMGPFDQAVVWSMDGIVGPRRFLERVWKLAEKVTAPPFEGGVGGGLENALHKLIKKVSDDIESMQFNTAISAFMIMANELDKAEKIPKHIFEAYLKLLAPFAPHITEELWSDLGHTKTIHFEPWPVFDISKLKEESVTIVVQINGKVRGEFKAEAGITEEMAIDEAKALLEIKKWIDGKKIQKIIFVKGKLVNIVAL